MCGVAVDLVGDGAAHRQVERVRRQQRVVRVGERLVVRQLRHQTVTRQAGGRERIEPQHVLLGLPGLHRHGAGVWVVRVALGGAFLVEFPVGGLEVAAGDQLSAAAGSLVPQTQNEVGVLLVDLGEQVCRAAADQLGGLLERLGAPPEHLDLVGDGERRLLTSSPT